MAKAPPRLLDQAGATLVIVLLTLSSLLSYSALLFGTAHPDVQAQGLFALLLSAIVLGTVGATLSSFRTTFVSLDGSTIAAMAVVTTGLIASLPGASPAILAPTLAVGLACTGALAGLALLALGWMRGGAIVRFVPLQVMAGLIAASGWSLLAGGVVVATQHPLGLVLLQTPDALLHGAPALAGAMLMLLATYRIRSPLVTPALILLGVALYHAAFAILGIGIVQQRADGWLLAAAGPATAALPWSPPTLALVDWGAVLHQAPAIAAAAVLACILVLVNANGLELATSEDIDLDRELRANGVANIASALAGGPLGNISLSRSTLLDRLGARSRWAPAIAALAVGTIPLAVPGLIGVVPRPVLGALLMLLGFGMLDTWLIQMRPRLSRAEWLTIPAVVLLSIWFGLPAAVFAGLAMGCVTFAVVYSLGSTIRARYRGDVAQSNVDRTDAERDILAAHADAVLVLYLQGFLFFGTVSRLLGEVKAELARARGTLRHLVMDCSNIDGLDGSALATLERLQQVVAAHGIALTYAALPPAAARSMGPLLRPASGLRVAPTLDEALEGCEADLLGGHAVQPSASMDDLLEAGDPANIAALAAVLERSSVPEGTALLTQGEASDHLVFLARGKADVMVAIPGAGMVRARRFGPGSMIGEIGFLLGMPRTATVRAVTDCDIWTLTRAAMDRLEAEQPAAALAIQRTVMARLSRRLLDKDHLIAALIRGSRNAPDAPDA